MRTRPWPPLWFLTHPEQSGEPFCDCEEDGSGAYTRDGARRAAKAMNAAAAITHGLVRYVAAPQRKARR